VTLLLYKKQEPALRKRAVIYCRVSTDKQEQDGESLEYQEEKCHRYAELHDINVVTVLKEAKSGFIHYSLREQLTLARQLIRDGLRELLLQAHCHVLTNFHGCRVIHKQKRGHHQQYPLS
jgi:predicted site-specific integrase-resolvase